MPTGERRAHTPGAFLAHLVFAPSFPFVIDDPQFFPEDFAQDLNPKLAAEIAARSGRVPTTEGDSRPWGRRSRWRPLSEWLMACGLRAHRATHHNETDTDTDR